MSIDDWRRKVDELDREIVKLLCERARIALEIGKAKESSGRQVFSVLRERQVMANVASLAADPLGPERAARIYREIISACRSLEKDISVSYLGPQGTFSHFAARTQFGSSVNYCSARDIASVFRDVAAGRADYGVAPIENSSDGAVNETLDMLVETDLLICAELCLEVHHCLLAKDARRKIRRIYSKPEVLAQCRTWLAEHYPDAELIPTGSTAAACAQVVDEKGAAAIAHCFAEEIYPLKTIAHNIEDNSHNVTRFIVLSRHPGERSERDKTSLVLSLAHRPGSLCEALMPFKKRGINLTWIVSRPSRKNSWEYYFFVDLEGHCETPAVRETLGELRTCSNYTRVLGSFPAAGQIREPTQV